MFKKLRQRLSTYRRRPSPIASLVDFSLWALRYGLPPWRLKFWVVLDLIFAGIFGAIFLPKLSTIFIILTSIFGAGVIFVMTLSYLRTLMGSEFAILEQTSDRLAARIAASNGLSIQGPPNTKKAGPEDIHTLANESFLRLLESDFIAAIANSHDQLREDVTSLQAQLNQGDGPSPDLAQLRADLNSFQRRTERQFRLNTGAIAHLATQLDGVVSQSSLLAKSSTKPRTSRPKSA